MVVVIPLVLLALVVAVKAYIAAAEAASRLAAIREHVQRIEHDLKQLTRLAAPAVAPNVTREGTPSSAPGPSPAAPLSARAPSRTISEPQRPPALAPASPPVDPAYVPHVAFHPSSTVESEIGSRWMLLAGVVVLVLGIAFFVKYAVDRHWINELARVALGTIAGVVVWAAGLKFATRGYVPFGRVLAGGGLAIMFVSAWAATALYGLVPPAAGFVWTVAVSVVAAVTADRQPSVGLALVAIVFAYTAPFLLPLPADHHRVLFTYEAILAASALFLVERHGWPALGLASWLFTWATFAAWLPRFYRDPLYASTETYLVVVSSVFLAMVWVYRRRAIEPFAKAAADILYAGPVLFHAASLYVLFNHSVSFLTYLIIVTAVCVSVASEWPAARLIGWLAVASPFAAWIGRHSMPDWYVPAFVTAAAIYLLHLWAELRDFASSKSPATAELVLFQFNGLGAFLLAYLIVDALAGSTASLAASMAAWHLVLAWRFRGRFAAAVPHALATAFTLIAASIGLALIGPWITVAYAAEGAALVVVGLWSAVVFFRYAGMALLGFAAWRLVALQFGHTAASFTPIVNSRMLTGGFIVAMLYSVAWLYRRYAAALGDEARQAIVVSVVAANLLTVALLTDDVNSFWTARPDQLTADFSRQLSISIVWAAYGMGAISIGFNRQSATLRYLALALFGFTLVKMFAVDLLELDGVYRIAGFIALGLVLLAASFLYQRQRPRTSVP